jgi:hypothetical protein
MKPEAARTGPTGVRTSASYPAVRGSGPSGGPTRGRRAHSVPGLAATLAMAAAGAVSCSSTILAAPPHPASRHPLIERSCPAPLGSAGITLSDTSPEPVVTVLSGRRIAMTVPRWSWGTATDIHVVRSGILREECTVLLPGGGRRAVFIAVAPGSTQVGATVEPASDLAMPAWGGRVIVQGARN